MCVCKAILAFIYILLSWNREILIVRDEGSYNKHVFMEESMANHSTKGRRAINVIKNPWSSLTYWYISKFEDHDGIFY